MEDINSRCRLCGRQNEKLKDIYESDNSNSDCSNLELPTKINKVLPIRVYKWDPLPHGICEACLDQLNKMDKFYEDTICADKFLRSLIPHAPKRKSKKIKPFLKLHNFDRVNCFQMLEMEDIVENEFMTENNPKKEDEEIDLPKVVILGDESQEDPIFVDTSPEKSPLVRLVCAGEQSEESISANRSSNKSPSGSKSLLVDLVFMDEPSEESTPVDKSPNKSHSANKSPLVNATDVDKKFASVVKIPKKSTSANVSPSANVMDVDESPAKPASVAKSSKKPPSVAKALSVDVEPAVESSAQSTSGAKSPKNPPSTDKPPPNTAKVSKSVEIIDLIDSEEPVVPVPKKKLDDFLIQNNVQNCPLYSCRQCYRTFLSSFAALSHTCEDSPEKKDPGEKTLPPLKIRVATSSNGKFICELCKQSFGRRTALITHQKTLHFTVHDESSDFSEHISKKKKKRKSRDSTDSEESNKSKRRKALDEENLRPDDHPAFHGAFNNNTCESVASEKSHQKSFKSNEKEENNKQNSFLVCEVCDEFFLTRPSLEEHKKKHSRHGSLTSGGDEEIIESDALTSGEDEEKEEGFKRSCIYCDKILTDRLELLEHQRNHLLSANILTPYDRCNRIEKKSDRDANSSVNVYICDACSISFDRKSAFIAHKKTHNEVTDSLSDDDIIQNSQD